MSKINKLVNQTRISRRLHKWFGVPIAIFLILVSVTAIMLAWKKEMRLIPETQKIRVESGSNWIPIEQIIASARIHMEDSVRKSNEIDRVDIRPEKGIAKVVFKRHFTEIQVDGYSGAILSVSQRNSDLIEKIHDGSILDFIFGRDGGVKHIYTTLTSVLLILLSITGLILWYNPKAIKKEKSKK
ncbi:putative iron-regulated membrane protein [Belliella baltica DSM 15883]|uniref:Putative iron-regulated membrane protein n=1 Tax=Belliella baltica (strain DSM 15883 / CIP 108006 / LMG 21964 / BA134) TaxID=866536 RepID=I3Z9W6_BELBD|nr:PepSY-associated TM helix domain-containing protein [Belliella baltica]AFL86034.1 putative iron-regulated membrane protein [Belliella baltica DSM 15883]